MNKEIKRNNKIIATESINQAIKEHDFQDAIDIAKSYDSVDLASKVYDTLIERCGKAPTYAGEEMLEAGLLKKAKIYSESVGNPRIVGQIEEMITSNKTSLKIINKYQDKNEENPKTWETIYFAKEGNKKAIEDLTEFIPSDVFISDLEKFNYRNN